MHQLKNLINFRNVPKNPKSNFNAVDDFLEVVITGYIIQGTLYLLGMSSLDDEPDSDIIASPELLWTKTDEERKQVVKQITIGICHKASITSAITFHCISDH